MADSDETANDITITSLTGSTGDSIVLRSEGSTNGNLTVGEGTFGGVISETGAGGTLTKNTAGTLTLTGANNYTGDTNILRGVIEVQNNAALGTGSVSVQNQSGAGYLTLADGITLDNNITMDESRR